MSRMCDFREGSRGRREERPRRVVQVATYANGRPYTPARGRYTERTAVEDCHAMIHRKQPPYKVEE